MMLLQGVSIGERGTIADMREGHFYKFWVYIMTSASVAKRRELQIKGWRREKKIALIEKMNPRWEDLAEHWGREMKFANQSINKNSI